MNVGIDILEIKRFELMAKDIKKLSKIFSVNEINYFKKFNFDLSHIAGSFCAKEAFVKALKLGFSTKLRPIDVEVLHKDNKVPYINISKEFLENLSLKSDIQIELSISHDKTQAIAICIIY